MLQEKQKSQILNSINIIVGNITERDIKILIGLGLTLMFWSIIPTEFFIGGGIFFLGVGLKLKKTVEKLDKEGYINKVSEQMREILLERSLYDLFADLWYFPKISLYLKAMFAPLLTQAPPDQTIHNFDDLSPAFKKLMLTKGLVNLLPLSVRKHLLPEQYVSKMLTNDPSQISTVDPQMQQMVSKVLAPEQQTQYYKMEAWNKKKNQAEQNATFQNNKIGFLKKFLQGSQNVSIQEYKKTVTLSIIAALILLVQLKRSPRSRALFKQLVLTILFFTTFILSSGGLILIAKHHTAQRLKKKLSKSSSNPPSVQN